MKDKINRDYLFLTYGPSSRMEYPNEWKKRMQIWDETIQSLSGQNDGEMENEINTNVKSQSMTITPDFILTSNQVHL